MHQKWEGGKDGEGAGGRWRGGGRGRGMCFIEVVRLA